MATEREPERIIITSGAGPDPAVARGRPRQRLTALGWLMLFWCGWLVVFSKTILTHATTSLLFHSISTNTPSGWWLNRFMAIVINTPIDMFLWAILDPDYGWIGCALVALALAALLFHCLAHVFEALGFLVYEEDLIRKS